MSEMATNVTTYNVTVSVKIPKVPNCLIMGDGQSISIADVTDSGLREIGEQWIQKLIDRANEIRNGRGK